MNAQRNTLGVLGILLPILDLGFNLIFGRGYNAPGVLTSISATYYSAAFVLFVGLVFGTGLFLICYRGYDIIDWWVSTVAGAGAIMLTLFPCEFRQGETRNFLMLSQDITNTIHLASAGVFFASLAVIIIFQFTKTSELRPTGRKLARNILYVICGTVMVIALVIGFGGSRFFGWDYSVYIGETIALWVFGIAWLTKGGLILRDV